MWTATTRAQHGREGLRFASDLTDAEWAVIGPLLPAPAHTGRPSAWPLREIVNAIFYVLRGGIPWRLLPPCFPPHQTVYGWTPRKTPGADGCVLIRCRWQRRGRGMAGQGGFFDAEERLRWLSASGDPLDRLRAVVEFEAFRGELEALLPRADRSRGGRPPYDAVLMFRVLVLQALYTLTKEEKVTLRDGGTPEGWSKARTRQIDREGRWTIKRGRKAPPPESGAQRQAGAEIAVSMFGYKNHLGIDRGHGFIRRFVVTHAARHNGSQLGAVLDPNNTASGVWADTAYRSRANVELLDRRGLVPEFQRAKPMHAHIARGNATRARVRSLVEHVFATEKRRMGLIVRSIGLVRATARITLANLAYNMRRLVWIEGRAAPA